MNRIAAAFVALLAFATPTRAREACLVHFDVKGIIAIDDAKTVRDLSSAYERYAYPDPVAAIVYAVRLTELSPTHGRTAVVNAAPRNGIEFWAAYHFGDDPSLIAQKPALRDVFDRYLTDLSNVAATTSSPAVMRKFLIQTVFSDGDEAEYLAGLNATVSRKNPALFRRCVREMKPEERRRICGTTAPCSRPDAP